MLYLCMNWEIRYHDDKLQQAVLELPPGLLARYLHCTDRMLEFGPDLGMPHTRAMSAGLFELRLKTDKTPPKELALARRRMKEWKNVDA